jgi:methionine sulfoxide reductase heme-binding subunit
VGKANRAVPAKKKGELPSWPVHLLGWLPLSVLILAVAAGGLGFNPVEGFLRWTGRLAVAFLLLSLACTPLHRIFSMTAVFRLRKPLGLYAALYAGLHFGAFAIWDYGLDWGLIWLEIQNKPFILPGLIALVILLALSATSFRGLRRKWGKAWVWLHRLAYLAGILIMLHYLLAVKGNLFTLQGPYAIPLIASAVLILLLALRLPPVTQALKRRGKEQQVGEITKSENDFPE